MDFTQIDWYATLPKFGVDPRYLTKKQGPCPICAAGGVPVGNKQNANKDRFRFDNFQKKGNYFCNACGSGNAMQLMRACSGMADADIMARLQELTGLKSDGQEVTPIHVETELTEEEIKRNRPKLIYAWKNTETVKSSDPVGRYLSHRVPGCDLSKLSRYVRYNRSMRYSEAEIVMVKGEPITRYPSRGSFPVMLGQAIDGERKPINLHRTYLTKEGRKAPVGEVKKQMKGIRKLKGAAVRICEVPESRILGVCEGTETAWAVATGYRYKINVWALLNAGNLAVADIPKGMFDKVIIFADHDKIDPRFNRRPGEHAAKQLQAKLMELGIPCEIRIPEKECTDFADVWLDYYNSKCRSQPYYEQAPVHTQPTIYEDQECHHSTPTTQQPPPATQHSSKWAGTGR